MTQPDDFALATPHPYAIYLPAIGEGYAHSVSQAAAPWRLPATVTVEDLKFWTGSSALWNQKFFLHSIGGYSAGSNPQSALFHKNAGDYFIVGDSGGFQIGKGTLKGLKGLKQGMSGDAAVAAWAANYDAKLWIIHWLEQYCDYAMTIDMPLWAATQFGVNSPFHRCTPQQLLQMTVENLEIIQEQKRGRTRWLNVVQGSTRESIQVWWDGVKWFRDGGWSLAGAAGWRGGLATLLHTVLMMRDEGAFEPGQNWLHVLGVSQPKWDVMLTAIQRELRKQNPLLQVSCDSATPFIKAGMKDEYALPVALGPDPNDWSIRYATLPALRSHADSANPVPSPLHSPIGQHLMLHHLVVDDSEFSGRRIDVLTNNILANHNAWVHLDAEARANDQAFNGGLSELPTIYAQALEVIERAFTTKDWRAVVEKDRQILELVGKNQF